MSDAQAERVRVLAAGVFGVPGDQVTMTSTPDDIATWDSFAQLNLMVALEDEFSLEFEPSELEDLYDLTAIAALVGHKLDE